jgi:hypothetical protein
MDLVARQPVDGQYETMFFKCDLCGKSEQIVVASDFGYWPVSDVGGLKFEQ